MSDYKKVMPTEYISPIPIPPGETIKEVIDELDMSQKEFAERLGISEKHLSFVINGKAEISRDLAEKLEYVLGIESLFWLGLENEFRESLKKVTLPQINLNEEEIAKKIPYLELSKQGFVKETRKIYDKVVNLRSFFGVSDLNFIPKVNCAFRKANISNENYYALATWIRIAEIQGHKIETQKFNKKKLINSLDRIRSLTNSEPEEFYKELVILLSDCGIALVVANHLKGTGVHGVTFLNGKRNKLIIQLSVRRKYADTFWFTLFHEISHIISDENEEFCYIDCNEDVEEEMNLMARNILIPQDEYEKFVLEKGYYSYERIVTFSEKIGINPAIVIGRLQFDKYISYREYTDKKPKYRIG